jgi:hypothetical protein
MRSVRHWATAMVVALLPSFVQAFGVVVGPVFPPPEGHTFTSSGTANAGDISRAAGQTFTIHTPLASRTAVWFGPQPGGVALSFSDPGFGSAGEVLTYDGNLSNPAGGSAVWSGATHFADGTPVATRFVVQASDAASGFAVPLSLAGGLGLAGSIGALAPVSTPPSGLIVSNHFQASLDGLNFAPALDVFDSYHGGKTSAFSSYTFGYYYVDTAPTIQPVAAIHLAVGQGAVIPLVYSDAQSDIDLLTLTLFNNNPGLLVGSLIGPLGSQSVAVTRVQQGPATVRVNVSDGPLSSDLIIQVLDDLPPSIAPMPPQVMQKNTTLVNLPISVGDDLTLPTDLVVTAESGNQALVPDANLVVSGTGSQRSLSVTPSTDAYGFTGIIIHVNDGHQTTSSGFPLTVNSPPKLDTNTGLSVAQGSTTPILASNLLAIDLDGADNQITFTLDFTPHVGSLKRLGVAMDQGANFTQQDLDDGSIAYVHDNSCNVSDNFGVSATDANGGVMRDGTFTSFTFNIAIAQLNLAPVGVGQILQVPLAGTANGTLSATNGDCITPTYTFSIATGPTKGTLNLLSASTGAFTYTATAGQVGADSFTFNVSDGVVSSVTPGTVSITIANTAPSVAGQTLAASEDGPAVTGTAVATDPDLPPQGLTYRLGTNGTRGTAAVNGSGAFSYLPAPGRMGTDTFTVIANDGTTDSAPATFTVMILPNVALGRYAVVSNNPSGVVLFDAVTGDAGVRAPLSGTDFRGITYGAAGLVAVNAANSSLNRVGAGSVTSFGAISPSPPFGPITIDTEVGGNLVVAQGSSGIGRYTPDGSPLAGFSGGNLAVVTAIAVGADGELYAADSSNYFGAASPNAIIRIHPGDGTQTVLASGGALNGGVFLGVARAADGAVYATLGPGGGAGGSIVKVVGNSAVALSTNGLLGSPGGITFDDSGNPVIVNLTDGALITIDRLTGAQTVLHAGPEIGFAFGLTRIKAFAVAPDVPTNVVATAGVGQATVSFVAPANDGGSPITGYTVTSSPQGHTATGSSSPVVVTALDNGVPYTFTVTATSAAGTSVPSAPSNAVTPRTVPDAPTSVSALAGNGQATVSFQAPAFDGGAAISTYTVTCSPGAIQASGAVSPVVVLGLVNGTQYSCTVVATNVAGNSISSAAATVTPFVPLFTLTVAKSGAGSGTVTSAPAGINCGTTCASDFLSGTLVTLSASAGALSNFVGWSGACAGNGVCNVTVDAAKSVTATFAQVATLSVTPTAIDFGGTSFGTTSPTHIVSVLNNGGATIHVGTVSTGSAQFAQINACATLAAGASCEVDLAYTPALNAALPLDSIVPAVATLTITSDASASPHTVGLGAVGEKSLVTHYYRSILRREPDDGGKAFWRGESVRVSGLGANVNETWFSMSSSFYGSPEYAAFNRDDTGFVTDMYTTFFNRPPDGAGLAFWNSQLAAGLPREVLLASFQFSPEFVSFAQNIFGNTAARPEVDVVVDFYRGILSRLPDSGGFTFWLQRFRTAQCAGPAAVAAQVEAISSSFTQSGEYIGHNRSGSQFVGDLYNAFLRRGGDLGGVQFWVNQVSTGGMTRETVRQNFLASPEFNARVAAIAGASCIP